MTRKPPAPTEFSKESIDRIQNALGIASEITSQPDLPQLTWRLLNRLLEVFPYRNASLFLADGGALVLQGSAVRAHDGRILFTAAWNQPDPLTFQFGDYITGQAAETGEPILITDVTLEPAYLIWEGAPLPIRSELALPLKSGTRVIGALNLESEHQNAFTRVERIILEALAGSIAIAIENARLFARLQETIDSLERHVEEHQHVIRQIEQERLFNKAESAVRLVIASMKEPADTLRVLKAIDEQLRLIGLSHDACSMQIVNKDGTNFISLDPTLHSSDRFEEPALSDGMWDDIQDHAAIFPWVLSVWKSGVPCYQSCVSVGIPSLDGRSLIHAPFSHGTLAVNHRQPEAFSENDIQILQRFGEILSDGFQRFHDLLRRAQDERRMRAYREKLNALNADPDRACVTETDNRKTRERPEEKS